MTGDNLQLQLFKQRLAQHVTTYEEVITQLQAKLLRSQARIEELEAQVNGESETE